MRRNHTHVLVAETESPGLKTWVRAAPGQRFADGDLVIATCAGAMCQPAFATVPQPGKLLGFAVRGREARLRAVQRRRLARLDPGLYTAWRTKSALRTPCFYQFGLDIGSETTGRPGMDLDGGDYRGACEQLWAVREELVEELAYA